jgi:hypothetical protein
MSLAWLAGGGCGLALVGDRTELKSRKGSNGVTSLETTMLPREPEKTEEVSEQEIDLPEQEIDLYDAIGRAIANLHAALAEVDAAWVLITAERPDPSAGAFAALDAAEQILAVAREDLARARTALAAYTRDRTEQ